MKRLIDWLAERLPPARLAMALAVPTILGLGLRLYRFDDLSIWLDEGFSIAFARLPWHTVLGFNGAYDTHPPLYYALLKAAEPIGPEVTIARLLSVLCGAISVGLIATIGAVLGGTRLGTIAGVAAATAPLLIWYSQEARQYAMTSVTILLTYLAIALQWRRPQRRWPVLYGIALAASLYLDYSSMYALLPQGILLVLLTRDHRKAALPMGAAAASAAMVFLPWLPSLLATAGNLGASRSSYLGLTTDSLLRSIGAVIGISGWGEYFASSEPPYLIDVAAGRLVASVAAFTLLAAGAITLRRNTPALGVVACLLLGTIATGAVLSLISPGLAPRTVSYATFGWALLLGATASLRGVRGKQASTWLVLAVCLITPLFTLLSMYEGGHKEEWRELAYDAERLADATELPIVIHPAIGETLIDTYVPAIHKHSLIVLADDPEPSSLARIVDERVGLIVAIYPLPQSVSVVRALEASELSFRLRRPYRYNLWLEVWTTPGRVLGSPYSQNLDWDGGLWDLPEGASVPPPGDILRVEDSTSGEETVVGIVPQAGGVLLTFGFEARLNHAQSAGLRGFVICLGGDGKFIETAPDGAGVSMPTDGAWHAIEITALCPTTTSEVRLDIRNAGSGLLEVREPHLRVLAAP